VVDDAQDHDQLWSLMDGAQREVSEKYRMMWERCVEVIERGEKVRFE
jgi:hypothetical protein